VPSRSIECRFDPSIARSEKRLLAGKPYRRGRNRRRGKGF
jgi:hypothetical protein